MSNHADCYALFSNLDDSEEHAILAHDGQIASITCGIYECPDKSGKIWSYRVLDEWHSNSNQLQVTTTNLLVLTYDTFERKWLGGCQWGKPAAARAADSDGIRSGIGLTPSRPAYREHFPGIRQSPELCEYPNALKELTYYILNHDQSLHEKVFSN